MSLLLASSRRFLAIAKQEQYGRYFLLDMAYTPDAYYKSCMPSPI